MLNSTPAAVKVNSNPIPRVLLKAKKEATARVPGEERPWDKTWDKGPWDKGHWAKRK